MKYLLSSDWHIKATNPRIRKDDYAGTQYKKIKWILETATNHNADVIVAGDIFDAPRCPFWLFNKYLQLFQNFKNNIWAVPGQHDMHFHNPDLNNTPLGTLFQTGAMTEPDSIDVAGAGWEQEVHEDWCPILVLHTPITPGDPPFFMEDAISAEDAMEKYKDNATLIVSGDYHVSHCTITDDRILCNPGPIMRASKDKMDYVPKVYLYDDKYGSIETIEVPIEKDVFDEKAIEQDDRKEYSQELKELIASFSNRKEYTSFWDVVDEITKTSSSNKEVKNIIKLIKEGV